jgi:uncharacterized protein (TIGR03118 family)
MITHHALRRGIAACLILLGWSIAAWSHDDDARKQAYATRNIVSDGGVTAEHIDPNLVNAWGIAFNPTGFVWVANNGTATSTLYDGNGNKIALTVTTPAGTHGTSSPTGIVFSASNDFQVKGATVTAASRFIFAGEHGTLSGWAPTANPTNAILTYDADDGALYKGLALASNGTGNFLYAADFHNNKIDVFDRTFTKVSSSGGFKDPQLPLGYAPFGIQNILGNLYVLYARQDSDAEDEIAGQGLGFVSVFDSNGNFIRRFASRGSLNAPWGIALAPADFGRFSNRLLIGNFGDGRIHAYDLKSGAHVGRLRQANGKPIEVEGLWGLSFGNGVAAQPTNTLFFTAGPNDEASGLYGRIDVVAGGDSHYDHDGDDD